MIRKVKFSYKVRTYGCLIKHSRFALDNEGFFDEFNCFFGFSMIILQRRKPQSAF